MARAKRRIEERPTLPSLVVPKSQAEAKIAAQIQKGTEIIGAHQRGELDENSADVEKDKWTDYNRELLRRLFDNEKPADEYWHAADRIFSEFTCEPPWGEPDHRLGRSQTDEEVRAYINALDDLRQRLELIPEAAPKPVEPSQRRLGLGSNVFIVHGHDQALLQQVARFIEKLEIKPVVLFEEPAKGQTVIEKLESNSDVPFALVLLTPDDLGHAAKEEGELHPRARQNVVLELGYFLGRLGRTNVAVLYDESVELPSNYRGVEYVKIDAEGAWKLRVATELKAAGLEVDMNKAI